MAIVTPALLLKRTQADLEAWVAAIKGRVDVAADELHALLILADSPGGVRLVLAWAGEENLSPVPEVFMVAQKVSVFVCASAGLSVAPGEMAHTATATRPALLDLVAQVRARMLSQKWDAETTAQLWEYKGAEVARMPDGIPLRAYRLTFTLDCTQAAVTDRDVPA